MVSRHESTLACNPQVSISIFWLASSSNIRLSSNLLPRITIRLHTQRTKHQWPFHTYKFMKTTTVPCHTHEITSSALRTLVSTLLWKSRQKHIPHQCTLLVVLRVLRIRFSREYMRNEVICLLQSCGLHPFCR